MDLTNFFKGLLIGFSIAAPVGPIAILCIKRTITSGRAFGLASGLGAASADAVYGSIAAFSLTIISNFLIHQQDWLRLFGGVFLCYLGLKTIISVPAIATTEISRLNLLSAYASTFFLTLTNPLTILFFAAVFAGLGLVKLQATYASAISIVAGVFLGSSCWWLFLSSAVHLLRGRIKSNGLLWVNRLSGLIILGFGIAALIGLFSKLT